MNRPAFSYALRLVLVLAALAGMALSAIAFAANLLQHAGDDYMDQATRATEGERQSVLAHAQEVYRQAMRIEPWQPSHAMRSGRAYEATAVQLSPLSDEAQVAWKSATESFRQAVRLHPANGRIHAALAWAALQAGDLDVARHAAHTALKLAPDFPDARFTVTRWYLVQWEALSVEEQQLATHLVNRGVRELPELYFEATWQLLGNLNTVRSILPSDPSVRRLLLNKLTERGLFADRWAELAAHPELQISKHTEGFQVIASGTMTGRQEPPYGATTVGPWSGMVEGWLSGGLTAKVELDLPPGEVVLFLPMLGEAAGGIWPSLQVNLGDHGLLLPAITSPDRRTVYVLLSTPGGRFSLHAVLSNGAVIMEKGHFSERRVQLGFIRVLTPRSIPHSSLRKVQKEVGQFQ